MRYEFGFLDYIEVLFNNTALYCVPHFSIHLKEAVDVIQLRKALTITLNEHPIFATRFVPGKPYLLEENDAEIILLETDQVVKDFGKTTNGYLWRITYYQNRLHFDFCHGLTDGHGMVRFITTLLEAYYELPITNETEPYVKAYEAIYDPASRPSDMEETKKGFTARDLPHIKNGSPSTLHHLTFDMDAFLQVVKRTCTSPVAVLLPLLSKAVYHSMPSTAKRRDIRGYFTADFRKPMSLQTGRNFIGYRYVTYTDEFETYDFQTLCTLYRNTIKNFLKPENVTYFCSSLLKDLGFLVKLRPAWLAHTVVKLLAPILKNDTNAYVTYLGALPFSKDLSSRIKDVDVVLYPDSGYCVMTAYNFNGKMKLSLCNNYQTDAIVPNLITFLEEQQISVCCSDKEFFQQAHLQL